jgi:hypothetical protein
MRWVTLLVGSAIGFYFSFYMTRGGVDGGVIVFLSSVLGAVMGWSAGIGIETYRGEN